MTEAKRPAPPIRLAESGNGRLKASPGSGLAVEIQPDPGIGARQWFNFGIDAPEGTRLRIADADASTYPRGWTDRVVWSRPRGGAWRPLRTERDNGDVAFTHGPPGGAAEYALFPPYPLPRLDLLRERARAQADAGTVEADADLARAPRISLGDGDPEARQVWIIAGQHGGEHPAMWFADGFADALLSRARLPSGIRFHVVPVANLSGMKAGHLRTNARGQDPNRHWAEPSACREVESLLAAMTATGVDVLLDVHTDCEMGCVYFDVLDEWMGTPAPRAAVRERFERQLARRSADVEFGRRYPWQGPPPPDLLSGMCAPAIERRFGAAAMTLELPMGRYGDAAGGERFWTPEHSLALGRAAASILMESGPD